MTLSLKDQPGRKDWTQDGSFVGADGRAVRCYDDVIFTRPVYDNEAATAGTYFPVGSVATVLLYSRGPVAVAQLELDSSAMIICYEQCSALKLHMYNEVKYPRFGLSAEQLAFGFDLAHHAALGAWAGSEATVSLARRLLNGDLNVTENADPGQDGKRAAFEELFRLAAFDPGSSWEVQTLTGYPSAFAEQAYHDIKKRDPKGDAFWNNLLGKVKH